MNRYTLATHDQEAPQNVVSSKKHIAIQLDLAWTAPQARRHHVLRIAVAPAHAHKLLRTRDQCGNTTHSKIPGIRLVSHDLASGDLTEGSPSTSVTIYTKHVHVVFNQQTVSSLPTLGA